ncbi:glycoside hydrolase family 73 protein [Agrilactobacillus yilanensis]|uniref:Glycoside hydrolase family 73 protein n=1 Tax=Agrilactobacillus yilanensis TaxID=2485997 RepID=A0ABW4JBE8_9LACO|nr:glycoside hydrolase family 73 protein [Agrilactobacillus yilanensis]
MANQRKRQGYRRKQQNNGLLGVLITLLILLIAIFGVVRGFEYHEASLQQAAIDSSKAVREKEQREKTAFINKIAPYAKQLYQTYHILPSITIAQAILESDWGKSRLASEYNNLFGVKSTDPNNSKVLDTQEYVDGAWQTVKGRFQVYDSYDASLLAHAKLLAGGTSWNQDQYTHVVNATDYVSAANGLQQDGYATDPGYAKKIIQIIDKYKLTQYDT